MSSTSNVSGTGDQKRITPRSSSIMDDGKNKEVDGSISSSSKPVVQGKLPVSTTTPLPTLMVTAASNADSTTSTATSATTTDQNATASPQHTSGDDENVLSMASSKGAFTRPESNTQRAEIDGALSSASIDEFSSEDKLTPLSKVTSLPALASLSSLRKSSKNPLSNTASAAEGGPVMTVETQTLPAKAAAVGLTRDQLPVDLLRSKKSTDAVKSTNKPKRKKSRAPVGPNASSKAEIFAAKVASAMDERDSSDSEETFVYDANSRRANTQPMLHRSRTPSISSINSGRETRGIHQTLATQMMSDYGYHVTNNNGRRSVKGANAAYIDDLSDNVYNTSSSRKSIVDDSPFYPVGTHGRRQVAHHGSKSSLHLPSRYKNPSRTNSPRTPRFPPAYTTSPNNHLSAADHKDYDRYDEEEMGFQPTERQPLMLRNQSSIQRLGPNAYRQDYRGEGGGGRRRKHGRGEGNRASGTFASILLFTGLFVITIISTFLVFQSSRSLDQVKLLNITNVLVTQDEVLLDLHITARNPNVWSVLCEKLDADLFAKSPYVSESQWPWDPHKGKKNPDDLLDGETMLLGNVQSFETPIRFPRGPWFASPSNVSEPLTGTVRLAHPANNSYTAHTDEESSREKW